LRSLILLKEAKNEQHIQLVRYLAKVSLQHCAVKSELENHSAGESLARESFLKCFEALKASF